MNTYYGYKKEVYNVVGYVPFEEDTLAILATGGTSYFCGFLLPPTCIALRKAELEKDGVLIPKEKIMKTASFFMGADKGYIIEHAGEKFSCNIYLPLQDNSWR